MSIHENYNKISIMEREAVDQAFDAAQNVLTDFGINVAGDDRAEKLVEAIATYIVESRPLKKDNS